MRYQIEGDTSLADQLVDQFEEKKMPFFDVRKAMNQAKPQRLLYRKIDTHWNLDGSYEGYKAFCEQTYEELGLKAFSRDQFKVEYKKTHKGDLIDMLGTGEVNYFDEVPNYTLIDSTKSFKNVPATGFPKYTNITLNENCGNQKTVLVFRDSYGMNFIPFLSLHFHKVIYIKNVSPYKLYIEKMVDRVRPDIVLSMCVERNLPVLFDNTKM